PVFPDPAPVGPYAPVAFSSFNGLDANGTWSLYIFDDTPGATGLIAEGWSLIIGTTGGNSAPRISGMADQTIAVDTSTGPIPFTISDPDTAPGNLQWSTRSSNDALVPPENIVLGGNGSNRTVTVTPVPGETGTANITTSVSDETNSTSQTFALTV